MLSDSRRIAIVFAEAERLTKGEEMDLVSENGAHEQSEAIWKILSGRGWDAQCIAVGDDIPDLMTRLVHWDPAVVFNLAETVLGESHWEFLVPSLLEFFQFAYTGSDATAIALCLDKSRTKEVLIANAIPTPAYRVMDVSNADISAMAFPVIVKPLREDGSLGIHAHSVVHDAQKLIRQIAFVAQHYGQPALVEAYVGEREFNVSILGNDPPVVLPACEIDYSLMPEGMPKIVGFAAKWFPQSPEYRGSMPVCPAPVSAALLDQVQKTALAAYGACGLRDYGRIDLRWDGKHAPAVVDVNPNPAISPDAGYILSARKAGLEYGDLVEKIARLALHRA